MREILFRGKSADTGKWIEGWYAEDKNDKYICNWSGYLGAFRLNKVIPDTIGEFTGFFDKNGKRIFEGDVVRDVFGRLSKVDFFNGRYCPFNLYPEYRCWDNKSCEVIGNIHDNPELLEEEE